MTVFFQIGYNVGLTTSQEIRVEISAPPAPLSQLNYNTLTRNGVNNVNQCENVKV